MSGIENITREILQEAEESAASELQEARAKAEEVVEKAREEANELSKKAHVKADADAKAFVERTEAEAESYSKRAVLLAKSEIIKSVLSKAKEKFLSAAPADYFSKLLSLIEKSAMKGEGEIFRQKEEVSDQKSILFELKEIRILLQKLIDLEESMTCDLEEPTISETVKESNVETR